MDLSALSETEIVLLLAVGVGLFFVLLALLGGRVGVGIGGDGIGGDGGCGGDGGGD
ncbi:MAG: hypothetical protein ACFE0R_03780 [Salinarimonas sp.]